MGPDTERLAELERALDEAIDTRVIAERMMDARIAVKMEMECRRLWAQIQDEWERGGDRWQS